MADHMTAEQANACERAAGYARDGGTTICGGAWPECSGDPACCPENEGYGCCEPNPAERAMGGE